MQTTRRLILPLLALVLMTGCALKGGKTPEGIAADYGVKIGRTVGAAQDAIHAIGKNTQNPTVRRSAIVALEHFGEVNRLGLELADRLDQIIDIRESTGNVDATSVSGALQLIDAIDAAIDLRVIPKLGDYPETEAALQAVREIGKLVLTIQFELGRLQ